MGAFADPEVRKKAMETRRLNREQKRLKSQNQATGAATTAVSADVVPQSSTTKPVAVITPPYFDWNLSPLEECVAKLSDMKREYDRAAQIVLQRQSRQPVKWECWTQKHKDIAPKAALAQCKKTIEDGRWVSRDDGYKNSEGKYEPAVCCSMLCYQAYQQRPREISALSRH